MRGAIGVVDVAPSITDPRDNHLANALAPPAIFFIKLSASVGRRAEMHVAAVGSNLLKCANKRCHSLIIAVDLNAT